LGTNESAVSQIQHESRFRAAVNNKNIAAGLPGGDVFDANGARKRRQYC
jgi:hypothetical protein